jgi:hypothetical protein
MFASSYLLLELIREKNHGKLGSNDGGDLVP